MGNYRFISLSYSIDRLASIDSIAIEQQQKFLNYFGPLHRIEQIIVRVGCDDDDKTSLNNDTNKYHGQIFEKEIFIEIFELIDKVKNLKVSWNNSNVTLDNICWRPMGETGECAILSPTNYFQNKIERFENAEIIDDFNFDEIEAYWSHLEECIKMPMTLTTNIGLSCFGEFGGPVEPQLIFGSEKNSKMKSVENYFFTSSILITIPVNGDQAEKARAWEIGFIEMMKNHKSNRSIITFSSESSISEELIQEANKDKWVSILACALVLVWLFTMLGNYYWPEKSILSIFVHQKFTIAFLTVFLSVVSSWCSIGVFSFFDIHATDNAIVVLFFIVTCIGINRSFIIIRAFQSDENCFGSPKMSINEMNERIVAVMSLTIPIVLTSSLICALCFVLTGGTPIIGVKMPAIETFARHAGLAIFVDLLFFMLILLPIFKYDAIRQLKGKAEIFSCYQLSDNSKIVLQNSGERTVGLVSPVEILKTNVAPWLMRSNVRLATYLIFLASLSSSIYCSFKLKYGFDQTMLFSKNGYLSKHFETMNNVVGIGPPVYFVIEGDVDWADVQVQNKFCSLPGCDEMSMGMIIRDLASESDATGMTPTSFLTGDVFVWIDTYLQFLNPKGKCCRKMENGTICISLNNNSTNCKKTCIYSRNENRKTRPNRMEFYKYLKHFLDFQPSVECASGGRATAKNAVSFNDESGNIKATYFWTFFKKLNISSSLELYTAMSYARFVATEIERRIGIDGVHIFAYSQFFPYFEPYFSIGQTLYTLAVLVLFVVFVTILLFLKVSVREALVTVFVLLSSFIHLMSWMYLMRIEMNVVSATNIAMSLGISVEFVIQVLYGYCNSKQLKSVDRASTAITKNGSTIISGILPAILLTAAALGVAESQILRVYFCFQLFGVGLVSTIHGVVYLPAMLALVGKDRYLEVLTVEETVATSPQSTEL